MTRAIPDVHKVFCDSRRNTSTRKKFSGTEARRKKPGDTAGRVGKFAIDSGREELGRPEPDVACLMTANSLAIPAVGLMRGIGLQPVTYLPFSLGRP
jgi:hypothetical protein